MRVVQFPLHHLPWLAFAPRRDPLGWLAVLARYGDLVKITLPRLESYFLFHPDPIRECLSTQSSAFFKGRGIQRTRLVLGESTLTAETETHRAHRRSLQPLFHRERLSEYADTICARTRETSARWRSGDVINLSKQMTHLTLAIAAEVFLGVRLDEGEIDRTSEALNQVTRVFGVFMLPWGDHARHMPLPAMKQFASGRGVLREIARRAYHNRRESELGLAFNEEQNEEFVIDELVTLLIAGHETTALMLTWTLYLLSQHRAVLENARAEIESQGKTNGARGPDIGIRLPYVRGVLSEALRLYPPVWGLGRRAVADVELCGERLPRGAYVTISPWVLHRDERFYPQPLSFCPERWLRAAPPSYAFIPFGGGPRRCIGEGFAWMEGALVLRTLLPEWDLEPVLAPPEVLPGFTLRPRAPLKLRVTRLREETK